MRAVEVDLLAAGTVPEEAVRLAAVSAAAGTDAEEEVVVVVVVVDHAEAGDVALIRRAAPQEAIFFKSRISWTSPTGRLRFFAISVAFSPF